MTPILREAAEKEAARRVAEERREFDYTPERGLDPG